MGNCVHCGQPAGLLRSRHKECGEQHDAAATKIPEFFVKALGSPIEPVRFREMTQEIACNNFIAETELRQLAINGLQGMITTAFADGLLTVEEEKRIGSLCNAFEIPANELGDSGLRLAKSQILRQLDEGKFPEGIKIDGLPINLERGETPVWLFNGVSYHTIRKRTQYVGGSTGVSFRIMKGVYYRVGAFKGEPISTQYLSEEGVGIFLLTSRNVYFWSPQKAVKIPTKKILSVQPYSDGLQIMRDAANATPQFFKVDDPLFACDAIARLNQV
jgi:hypothetical protein